MPSNNPSHKRPKKLSEIPVINLHLAMKIAKIKSDVYHLVSVIAMTEDQIFGDRAPDFYCGQLRKTLGGWSESKLRRVREKAQALGWLEFTPAPQGSRKPGIYRTKIPADFAASERGEMICQNDLSSEDRRSTPVKTDGCHPSKRDGDTRQNERPTNPYLPNPNLITIPHHDDDYEFFINEVLKKLQTSKWHIKHLLETPRLVELLGLLSEKLPEHFRNDFESKVEIVALGLSAVHNGNDPLRFFFGRLRKPNWREPITGELKDEAHALVEKFQRSKESQKSATQTP